MTGINPKLSGKQFELSQCGLRSQNLNQCVIWVSTWMTKCRELKYETSEWNVQDTREGSYYCSVEGILLQSTGITTKVTAKRKLNSGSWINQLKVHKEDLLIATDKLQGKAKAMKILPTFAKLDRYVDMYIRKILEKIVQSFGRTSRHCKVPKRKEMLLRLRVSYCNSVDFKSPVCFNSF